MPSGRGRQGSSSRTGTILVLAGIVGVLTTTFVAGVWTGRHWPLLTGAAKPGAPPEPPSSGHSPGERPKQAEPLPALTFYHELTAPLTAPPPPPRPAKPGRAPAPKREPEKPESASVSSPLAVASQPPAAATPTRAEPTTPGPEPRFTVQVGAYNVRTPAEALRTALATAGHDARVVEAQTPAGLRYRVHVGAFPSREAARETAAQLSVERSVKAFVTTR